MGGRFSRKQAADGAPAGNGVVIEAGLAEALASQRNRRDAAQRAADAVGNPDAAADATVRKLAADFEAERRAFQESRAAELSSLEADRLDDVKRQVALLHSKYDFVRKEAAPRCVAEEKDVLDCYASKSGAGVLQCAAVVDAYTPRARAASRTTSRGASPPRRRHRPPSPARAVQAAVIGLGLGDVVIDSASPTGERGVAAAAGRAGSRSSAPRLSPTGTSRAPPPPAWG